MARPTKIVWSQAANRDLGRLYEFYYPRSPKATHDLTLRIFNAVDGLVVMPEMGRVSEHGKRAKAYRELVVGTLKIFYRVEGSQLRIARLWDTRQDPAKFSLPEDA